MIVFIYHLYHHFYHQWQPNPDVWYLGIMVEGHTGVGLFFVLSGFILMLIRMNASDISYWGFMRNRFLRIFPLFLVIYFVAISIGRNEFRPADILYVFFSNLGMAPTSNSFITGAAWTISVEFTFYALFPFVAYAATNKGVKYLLQLIFIIILFKIGAFFISESPKHMYYSTILGRIDQFLIGMIAAMLYVHFVGRKWCRHWIWFLLAVTMAWSGVGVMAGLSSYQAKEQHDIFWAIWPTVEALLWAGVVITYLSCTVKIPKVFSNVLEVMGKVSYSWYLLHGLVLWLWGHVIGPIAPTGIFGLDLIANLLVVGVFSLALAKLSYHTLEEPFIGLRHRYTV
jgi:peptidoglycan/LPS O-acetylase OafA/YrhL